jgi:hypothetical protein
MTQPIDEPIFHPYLLCPDASEDGIEAEWIDPAELQHATNLAGQRPQPLRFLVLYGSLRER